MNNTDIYYENTESTIFVEKVRRNRLAERLIHIYNENAEFSTLDGEVRLNRLAERITHIFTTKMQNLQSLSRK